MKSDLAAQIAQYRRAKTKRTKHTGQITQEYLQDMFWYNNQTGNLHWKHGRPGVRKDSVAGSIDDGGYRVIRINRVLYKAHRLIWLFHHGYMPEIVDHINHERSDNRISNLRETSISENNANMDVRSDNKSGFKGVSKHKATGKWVAKLKGRTLGYFSTPELAAEAYRAKAEEAYGEFFNDTTGQSSNRRRY